MTIKTSILDIWLYIFFLIAKKAKITSWKVSIYATNKDKDSLLLCSISMQNKNKIAEDNPESVVLISKQKI